jgi:Flavoprotein
MTVNELPPAGQAPAFGAERLLLFGTGSLGVTLLPWWVDWLGMAYPHLEVQVVVTRSALRFVGRHSLGAVTRRGVAVDAWPGEPDEPVPHMEYATWPDAIAVYPATFHFVARFTVGLADTPMTLALQCTSAVVGVAPALPPGAAESFGYRQHLAALSRRPNVTVAHPIGGQSAHTGGASMGTAAPLPVLLYQMEMLRRSNGSRAEVIGRHREPTDAYSPEAISPPTSGWRDYAGTA